MAKKNEDVQVLERIEKVKKRKAEIAKAERPNWKTNSAFSYDGSAKTINIKVVKDLSELICIVAFLRDRSKSYVEAAMDLGVKATTVPKFKWMGFTVGEWVGDIRLRVTKIQIDAKKKSLEALEARLEKVISPALRRKMELEAITKELE